MTIRDDIAKGQQFDQQSMTVEAFCGQCGGEGPVDKTTGLCRPCWRSWRFGDAGLREQLTALRETVQEQARVMRSQKDRLDAYDCAPLIGNAIPHEQRQRGPWQRFRAGEFIETQMTPEQMARSRCPSCGAFRDGSIPESVRHEMWRGEDGKPCANTWHKAKP